MARLNYWLLKSEPDVYSFEMLIADQGTFWDKVRNYQARNFLGQIRIGDVVFIYHTGDERAIAGLATVTHEAYPDPDPNKKGDWLQIDLIPVRRLKRKITLKEIKDSGAYPDFLLLKQSRLSVMPVSSKDFHSLVAREDLTIES